MSIGPVGPSKSTGSVYKKADLTKMSKKDLIRVIHKQLAFLHQRTYTSKSNQELFVDITKKLNACSREDIERKIVGLEKAFEGESARRGSVKYKAVSEALNLIKEYNFLKVVFSEEFEKVVGEIERKKQQATSKVELVKKGEMAWLEKKCKEIFKADSKSLSEKHKFGSDNAYVFLVRAALSTGRYDELKERLAALREEHQKFSKKYVEYKHEMDGFIAQQVPRLGALSMLEIRVNGKRIAAESAIKKILEMEDSKEPVEEKISEARAIILSSPTLGVDKLHKKKIDGKGVTVAVIDSGLYPHPDFKDRILAYKDFADFKKEMQDDFGHGTHVAGIIAGDGKVSNGRYKGVAPAANIIGIKGLNEESAYSAVTWIAENKDRYNIKIVNISMGWGAEDKFLQLIFDKLVKNGITVVGAVGNFGPLPKTIAFPSAYNGVIGVGNLDQSLTTAFADDNVAVCSSRGPKLDGTVKPDILAPGSSITSTISPEALMSVEFTGVDFNKDIISDYVMSSGTSMAAPFVSGVVALMYQVNPDLTPAQIDKILKETAYKLPGISPMAQGSGIIDPQRAVEAARSLKKVNDE